MAVRHLLILGGTGEASALARAVHGLPGWRVTSSLAGRTRNPVLPPGEVRIGGFGGAEGLAAWIAAHGVDAVIDATHPFAERIAAHAAEACASACVPRLKLLRPAWEPEAGDRWTFVPDLPAAAEALPPGVRVFLATGRQGMDAFAGRADLHTVVRLVDPPDAAIPLRRFDIVLDRGPFDPDAERRLLEAHRIDWVVAKNSGGEASRGKLLAARALGLPVLVVRRPVPPAGPRAETVAEATGWLERLHG